MADSEGGGAGGRFVAVWWVWVREYVTFSRVKQSLRLCLFVKNRRQVTSVVAFGFGTEAMRMSASPLE